MWTRALARSPSVRIKQTENEFESARTWISLHHNVHPVHCMMYFFLKIGSFFPHRATTADQSAEQQQTTHQIERRRSTRIIKMNESVAAAAAAAVATTVFAVFKYLFSFRIFVRSLFSLCSPNGVNWLMVCGRQILAQHDQQICDESLKINQRILLRSVRSLLVFFLSLERFELRRA